MAKIGVIGAGAIGGYYGARLAQAGHDVRFLMRRDLAAVRQHGLRIRSWQGDFTVANVATAATPDEIGPCDLVLCALKATALDEAEALLAPCVGPETRILAIMNGLGVEDRLAGWFGGERILGGMAFVCLNRGEPGVIHHIDYGRLTIGHYTDDAAQLADVNGLLTEAGLETVAAPELLRARWEKLCWNIPFNGLSVAAGGIGTATILGDPVLRDAAEAVMREVVQAGNADLAAAGSGGRLDEEAVVAAMFGQTATMGDYRTSMVLDYINGAPLEVDPIFGEPLRRARALGVPSGALAMLHAAVYAADQRNRGRITALNPEPIAG